MQPVQENVALVHDGFGENVVRHNSRLDRLGHVLHHQPVRGINGDKFWGFDVGPTAEARKVETS